jgi:hypothetical protein
LERTVFSYIGDSENWQKAQPQLNELKLILPEHDPAIVEAQTSLKLASV